MRWMFPVMKIPWSTSSQEWKFSGAKVLCVEQKSIILHNAHCEVSSMQWPLCGLPKLPLNNAITAKRKLWDTVKARKLAYYGHTMRKPGNCLEEEIMQGTMPGVCRRGRPCTAWIDNKSWTGLPVEESIRMTEDRDKWRKHVYGVANPQIKDG